MVGWELCTERLTSGDAAGMEGEVTASSLPSDAIVVSKHLPWGGTPADMGCTPSFNPVDFDSSAPWRDT